MRRFTIAALLAATSLTVTPSAFAQVVPALGETGAHASADAKSLSH